jgi:hypothetical protein
MSRGRLGNIGRLLDRSLQSYYWLGFILADGSFSNNNQRFKVSLGEEDQEHLRGLVEYLDKEYKNNYSCCFMDTELVPLIHSKLGLPLTEPKMYSQPEILKYDILADDEFLALFVGFIDGDGSIQYQTGRETTKLSIKLHISWLAFLDYLISRFYDVMGSPCITTVRVNSAGKAYICVANFKILKDLKRFTLRNDIPILKRKWDRVDLNLETKDEKLAKEYSIIKDNLGSGSKHAEIAARTGISVHKVKRISASLIRR